VVGTVADQLAGEIREAQRSAPAGLAQPPADSPPTPLPAAPGALTIGNNLPDGAALVAALGGRANVLTAEAAAGRVRVGVIDAARVNREALLGLGLRGVALPEAGCVHLLTGTAMSAGVAALLARARS
jgi:N-acetylglucosamine PTS system EIICBA or EIICB component